MCGNFDVRSFWSCAVMFRVVFKCTSRSEVLGHILRNGSAVIALFTERLSSFKSSRLDRIFSTWVLWMNGQFQKLRVYNSLHCSTKLSKNLSDNESHPLRPNSLRLMSCRGISSIVFTFFFLRQLFRSKELSSGSDRIRTDKSSSVKVWPWKNGLM